MARRRQLRTCFIALGLFTLALIPRLWFVLEVRPLGVPFVGDATSYAIGANRLLEAPFEPNPTFAFWPFGTSALAAAILAVVGRGRWEGVGLVWAALGAASVVLGWDIARFTARSRWVPTAVAVFGVVCYPLVVQCCFLMSELPFTFFFTAQVWLTLRWLAWRRRRDAAGAGVAATLAMFVRPQQIVSSVLVACVLARRRPKRALWAAVPLVLGVVFGTGYLQHNSGRHGFISHNSSMNLIFGRCHNRTLEWRTGSDRGFFTPAGLNGVYDTTRRARARGSGFWLDPDPAMGHVIRIDTRPGRPETTLPIVAACVRRAGLVRQVRYAVVNVAMLWHGTALFPRVHRFGEVEAAWRWVDRVVLEGPFFLGLGWFLVSRSPARRVVAANALGLVVTVALFFGELRYRLPYTFVIAPIAFEVWATMGRALLRRWVR